MTRSIVLVALFASTASAEPSRPMQLEFGFNTRHFAAAHVAEDVAFRSTEEPDPALAAGTAVTGSLRFTGRTRYNTFLGVEAETGYLLGIENSNLGGAYGLIGMRHDLGSLRIAAEVAAGRRWIRYAVVKDYDASVMMAEPRVRGDLWLSPKVTLGGAVGATIGDRSVWMAGVYIGLHDFPYDRF